MCNRKDRRGNQFTYYINQKNIFIVHVFDFDVVLYYATMLIFYVSSVKYTMKGNIVLSSIRILLNKFNKKDDGILSSHMNFYTQKPKSREDIILLNKLFIHIRLFSY